MFSIPVDGLIVYIILPAQPPVILGFFLPCPAEPVNQQNPVCSVPRLPLICLLPSTPPHPGYHLVQAIVISSWTVGIASSLGFHSHFLASRIHSLHSSQSDLGTQRMLEDITALLARGDNPSPCAGTEASPTLISAVSALRLT